MTSPPGQVRVSFRLLIVDNDPLERDAAAFAVETLGFTPVVAQGSGRALREDAIRLARQEMCHLALVDMRLVDDNDSRDRGGLELIPDLFPALSIIYSGPGRTTPETIDDAHNAKGYVGFISKSAEDKSDQALDSKMPRILEQNWNPRLDYDLFETGYVAEDIIRRLQLPNWEHIPEDDIDNLMRRYYRDDASASTSLRLRSIDGPYDSANRTPSLRRSAVFSARVTTEHPLGRQHYSEIIKFAPREDVEREWVNYQDWVDRQVHGRRALIQPEPVLSWDMGLIRYTDEVQGERKTFAEWYGTKPISPSTIKEAIEDLFGVVLRGWYNSVESVEGKTTKSVYGYYSSPDLFSKFGSRINSFLKKSDPLTVGCPPDKFINPVQWARNRERRSRFESRWDTLVHGDLHSSNILVDRAGKTYVIDYERSERGYYLRDFVELEKDIRLRLLPLDENRLDLAEHLDCLLMSQVEVGELPVWKDPPDGGVGEDAVTESQKAFDAICAIRNQAANVGGLQQMDEYYWALLMETLLTVTDERVTGFAHQRALLSASLICERLEAWDNPRRKWPPGKVYKAIMPAPAKKPIANSTVNSGSSEDGKYALLIGVGDTPNVLHLSLPASTRDAQALGDALVDGSVGGFSGENVRVLTGDTASLPRIRTELEWLANEAKADPNAAVVVYFSGHGGHLRADDRYFLIPSSVDPGDVEGSVLWASEFTERLQDIEAERVLVFIDACHAAGTAAGASASKEPGLLQSEGFVSSAPPRGLLSNGQSNLGGGASKGAAISSGKGRVVISSSTKEQRSWIRKDETMSIFTHHLLDALRGDATKLDDHSVWVSTLFHYLQGTVPVTAKTERNVEQAPWMEWDGQDWIVCRPGTSSGHAAAGDPLSASDSDGKPKGGPGDTRPVRVFYAYSHEDSRLRNRLHEHLSELRRLEEIDDWYDRKISPGAEWAGVIHERLNSADIILLLISPSFLNSDYCYQVEMKRALERHAERTAKVIPVILRPVNWERSPIGSLLALPTDAKPVTKWSPRDDGYKDVADGIQAVVEELRTSRT